MIYPSNLLVHLCIKIYLVFIEFISYHQTNHKIQIVFLYMKHFCWYILLSMWLIVKYAYGWQRGVPFNRLLSSYGSNNKLHLLFRCLENANYSPNNHPTYESKRYLARKRNPFDIDSTSSLSLLDESNAITPPLITTTDHQVSTTTSKAPSKQLNFLSHISLIYFSCF